MTERAVVHQIFRRSSLLFGGQVAMAGLLAINNLLIARLLGPIGKGEVATLVLLPTGLAVLLGLGLANGIPYQVSRGQLLARDAARIGGAWAVFLACLLVVAYFCLRAFALDQRFPVRDSRLLALSMLTLPALLLGQILEGTLIACGRERVVALLRVGQAGTYLILVALIGGTAEHGVWGIYGSFFAASLGSTSISFVICRRQATAAPPSEMKLGGVLNQSKGLYLNAMADFFVYRLDWILLSLLMPISDLGVYSVAVPFSETLWFLTAAVRPILFAALSSGKVGDRGRVTLPVLLATLGAALVLGIMVHFVAVAAVHYWLPRFGDISEILAILLAACGAALVFQFLQADLNSRGLGTASALLGITTAVVGIGVYGYLVPRWGTRGACWSSLIVYSFDSVLTAVVYVLVQRRAGLLAEKTA